MNSSIKKFFAALLLVSFTASFGFAADDGDNDKKFRFGIKVNPMLSWFRPDDKGLEKGGVKGKFGYGLMAEFRLNSVISFATGIGGDYEGGKLNFKDSVSYYVNDEEIIGINDADSTSGRYLLLNRDYSINYVNVPLTLKMKTKDIGGMTYYAIFGGDLGVRTKSKVTDQVIELTGSGNTKSTLEDIDNTSDMNLLRTSLNVGGGFEYNLAGSTSLVVGVNYRRGFLPAVKKTSDFLQEISNGEEKSFKSTVLGDGLLLTVGILF